MPLLWSSWSYCCFLPVTSQEQWSSTCHYQQRTVKRKCPDAIGGTLLDKRTLPSSILLESITNIQNTNEKPKKIGINEKIENNQKYIEKQETEIIYPYHPEEHIILPAILEINGKKLPTFALLDSGATSSFINQTLVTENNLPSIKKKEPRILEVIDGRPISSGNVTHETPPVLLTIGAHSETLVLDVVQLGHYPVILGVPWLKKHNPHIYWSLHQLHFNACPRDCGGPFPPVSALAEYPIDASLLPLVGSSSFEDSCKETPSLSVDILVPQVHHEYLEIFSKEAADLLPVHRSYDHTIPLVEGSSPPYGPIYSLSAIELKALAEYLDENLRKGFIRPSTSPAGAPILFVKKKDGSLRLCVDYRGLNKITIKNRYPLPLIHELLDRLQGAHIFTRIDLRGAYNLVRIAKGEEWKTAFRTRYGHFEYLVMPFGLTNAPATFQNLMNDILRDFLDVFVIVYLDDILIFSKTKEDHIGHVSQVLDRLQKTGLVARAEKCEFHKSEVEFLGYVMSSVGVKMDAKKLLAIKSWPPPASITDVQAFLGFANFYRRFIWNYSKIAAPLTTLLKKDASFRFDGKALEAFEFLKNAFMSAPILMHFDPSLQTIIETDASDYALGAVLSQISLDKQTHPVAYYSRKFTEAELNYDIYDKEMLAIVAAIREWRPNLEGSRYPFTIYTDHKNLEYFITTKSLNRRQARWAEFLAGYDFTIIYRPGEKNGKADAMSRRHDYRPQRGECDSIKPLSLLKPNQLLLSTACVSTTDSAFLDKIREALLNDQYYLEKKQTLLQNQVQSASEVTSRENFEIKNDLLYCDKAIYVPDITTLRQEVLKRHHDDFKAGHFGITKTLELVSRHFWWPGVRKYVKNYVLTCDQCQRSKTPRHKPHGLLQPLPVPHRPWISISMDFIVKLPLSQGYDSILVVVDRFSKMAHFIPCCETITTPEVASLFLENIFKHHGLPSDIVSDRGSVFVSKFWQRLMELLKVKTNTSTSHHPQSDGQTERVNAVLEQYLRSYCNYQQNDWVSLLTFAQFSYNNASHSATGTSPFFANYGYHPTCDPQLSLESKVPAAEGYILEIQKLHESLAENITASQANYSKFYNRKVKESPVFLPGVKVWLMRKFIKTDRPCEKLDHRRLGPFNIIEKIGNLAYRLELPSSMKIHNVFHVSLLEAYHEDSTPGRFQVPPAPIEMSGHQMFEIEGILDSRIYRKQLQYLVQWKGYGPQDNTWEPLESLETVQDLVEEFHRLNPRKPRPPRASFGARP